MTYQVSQTDMLIEAVDHYVQYIKDKIWDSDDMLEAYTELLNELESSQPDTFGPTGLVGDPQ
jgi:hypothetical protein